MSTLTKPALLRYSLIAFPIAFAGLPVYILAPGYYVAEYGVSLATLGAAVMLIRGVDALCIPVIGYIADHLGHWRKWLVSVDAVLFGLGFYLLFVPVRGYALSCFVAGMIICALSYSFISIILNTTGALWSGETADKVRIASWREVLSLIGVLFACAFPPLVQPLAGARGSYLLYSLCFLGLLAISVACFVHWLTHSRYARRTRTGSMVSVRLRDYFLRAGRRMHYFYAVYFFSALSTACASVMVNFFIVNRLQLPQSSVGGYLLAYFVFALLGVPLWRYLGDRIGLLNAWLTAMLGMFAVFIWGLLLGQGDAVGYGFICAASGVTLGAELILPASILAVMVDNEHQAALANGYYAFLDFIMKLSLAVASGICLPVLAWFGFQSGGDNGTTTLWAISGLYIGLPCLFKLVAMALLLGWRAGTTWEDN